MSFPKFCRPYVSGHQFAACEGLQIQDLTLSISISIHDPIDSPLRAITKRNQFDITSGIGADSSFALGRVLGIQYMEAGSTTFKTLTAWNPANNGGGSELSTGDKQLIGLGNEDAIDSVAIYAYTIWARDRLGIKARAPGIFNWKVIA